ncbi:MAG: M20/M25/M40 family metallo-hydrolase [Actinomycetota bacterium]|nr:M20/M25/M40 family metallo-hydrolase [Actinomycetota bacterium]
MEAALIDVTATDAAIDAGTERAFDFLSRLVAAPSTLGHEETALTIFADEITDLGFKTRRIPLDDGLADDPRAGAIQDVPGERYDVLGSLAVDQPGRSLLLNGHIDVVPAETPHRWSSPPFEPRRADSRLYGRGSGDMKCGFAMGALALRALLAVAPDAITGPLHFLAVIEEECTGNGTLAAARQGVLADAVVLLEPTDLGVLVGGVGVLWCDVEIVGFSAHAQAAHLAVNPLDLSQRLVAALREWSGELARRFPDPELTDTESPYNLNVGVASAGDWPSCVPAEALLRMRFGFPRAWTPADAEREVRQAIAKIVSDDGGFPAEPTVRLSGFRAPGYLLDHDHPLTTAMAEAHQAAHGTPARVFSLGSTTDARIYLNHFDVPALCYGPAAADIHGIDESVDLASIVAGAKTLTRFIARWYEVPPAGAGRIR